MAVAFLAAVTSIVAAIPGVVLVLRRQSMLTDAISHAVLPGIVIAAMITQTIDSPWLLVGATIAGVVVVMGTQWIKDTGLVAGDSATGLVFPPLFALGVILLTRNFRSSHLSEHSVLIGEFNYAVRQRVIIGTYDFGPRYAWILICIAIITMAVLLICYRPLLAISFDLDFARVSGVRVALINQIIMVLMCLVIVAAFHVAGSILVVALMIVPAACGSLLVRTVPRLIGVSVLIAVVGSQLGFWLGYHLDRPTSAMMAFVDGLIFVLVFVLTRVLHARRARTMDESETAAASEASEPALPAAPR